MVTLVVYSSNIVMFSAILLAVVSDVSSRYVLVNIKIVRARIITVGINWIMSLLSDSVCRKPRGSHGLSGLMLV